MEFRIARYTLVPQQYLFLIWQSLLSQSTARFGIVYTLNIYHASFSAALLLLLWIAGRIYALNGCALVASLAPIAGVPPRRRVVEPGVCSKRTGGCTWGV